MRDAELQARYTDQELFNLISRGHAATPMLAFGGLFTSAQIEQLVDYIRRWRGPQATPTPGPPPSFANDVMPILEERCSGCHSGDTTLGGWDMTTHDSVINSGDHGPGVVPEDPEGSLLVRKIKGIQSVGTIMPPSGPMAQDEIQVIIDWIAAGAPDN